MKLYCTLIKMGSGCGVYIQKPIRKLYGFKVGQKIEIRKVKEK